MKMISELIVLHQVDLVDKVLTLRCRLYGLLMSQQGLLFPAKMKSRKLKTKKKLCECCVQDCTINISKKRKRNMMNQGNQLSVQGIVQNEFVRIISRKPV